MQTKKWSLLNKDKTEIVRTITNGIPRGKRNLVGGRGSANHAEEWLLSSGWLPHVEPVLARFQAKGSEVVELGQISYSTIDLSEPVVRDKISSAVEVQYDLKKILVVPSYKRERAQVRGIYLNQKAIMFLAGKGPDLTLAEKSTLQFLNALAERVLALDDAGAIIKVEADGKTYEELLALPVGWESSHAEWPE